MGHWTIIGCLSAGFGGALVFLALVSHELRLLHRARESRKAAEAERRARERAHQEAEC